MFLISTEFSLSSIYVLSDTEAKFIAAAKSMSLVDMQCSPAQADYYGNKAIFIFASACS